jgi:hypothetical protein
MLRSSATLPEDAERLADTPVAAIPDPPVRPPLSRRERLNVVFVVAASQLMQMLIVAAVTATVFLVLGLILLSPALLAEWTNHGPSKGTLLGMTVPVPEALIQMSRFLAALTFMYLSARAVGDGEYRSIFLDPLIDDLHANLIARNRYRSAVAEQWRGPWTNCDGDGRNSASRLLSCGQTPMCRHGKTGGRSAHDRVIWHLGYPRQTSGLRGLARRLSLPGR